MTAPKKITLATFEKGEIALVEKFVLFWRRGQRINPALFPMTMEPGEWDEQYRCWSPDHSKKILADAANEAES